MNVKKACGLHCIKINNLGVTSGGQELLRDVSIHIHCGQLTVIIGRNGAGKTTLLRSIMGDIRHTGNIVFTDHSDGKIKKLRIGYVPQSLNFDSASPTSVYDLCAAYTSNAPVFLYKSRKIREKILEKLNIFGASDIIDQSIGTLSGGELQRVLLAIASMSEPNLLILDEPVSGIDRAGLESFYKTIQKLKTESDIAIILVSHDLEFAKKYADKVVLLERTVKKSGEPFEVFNSPEFKEIFGG